MRYKRLKIALLVLLPVLGVIVSGQIARANRAEQSKAQPAPMSDERRAVHALNRLTFGPRPGDVDRILATGVDKWIDQQLQPDTIDDTALTARLQPLRTLRMDTREMVEAFPSRQLIKAIAEGKESLPSDPVRRAIYEAQVQRYQEKVETKQDAAKTAPLAASAMAGQDAANGDMTNRDASNENNPSNKLSDDEISLRKNQRMKSQEFLDLPPAQRVAAVLKLSPEDRRAMSASLKGDKLDDFVEGMNPEQRETLIALNNPEQVVTGELVQSKLLRATYSERQLQEVLTDFWFNHFNVFLAKGADRYMVTSYERDVIRPHVLGKFEDLLVATARSPAMLFYLDNWLSVGPNSDFAANARRSPQQDEKKRAKTNGPVKQAKGKRGGLNENYGRELMELHTLGVNGGYTQQDVTEVARVLTGWGLKRPKEGDGFTFQERMHEPGEKIVLGHRIKPNGEKEGLELLHILAHHPSTARFISTKLATRFVSDNPPPALVDRMSRTFMKKDGDIREVLKTMLKSPEFWSDDAYRAKVKTPLEYVVSALRASGAEFSDPTPVARQLQTLGMPLYGMQPPTGYSMKAATWVNSSALLGRMNFALALTSGKLRGIQVDSARVLGASPPADAEQALTMLETNLLLGDVSQQTHDTIASQMNDPKLNNRKLDDPARPPNVGAIAGLLLGSPEFQRR